MKCFRQNEEFDVGTSSSVVLSRERSVRTSEISTAKGEASFVGLASDVVNFEVVRSEKFQMDQLCC